ncbi:MAG TPA: DUF4159 domain-containing protein [Gemmatimonadaceae bacterium]|nr:DUF4159 domain-containing protein [Gemmatimonadaceae bacterium]
MRRLLLLLLLPPPLLLAAQGRARAPSGLAEVPYDGDFTFSRVRYGGGGFRRGGAAWAHDYPRADQHLPQILQYVSTVPVNLRASNVFDLDDPEIFRHPILYLSEPGFWRISDTEAAGLRAYLLKGGFLILDDFEEQQWYNMEEQLRRAMPEYELIEIGPEHAVFRSFFELDDIYVPHPLVAVTPRYYAMFEGNDPARRMLVLVNFNADLAEYWEWSAEGILPVDLSNEAYKLGVNYLIYGLTH